MNTVNKISTQINTGINKKMNRKVNMQFFWPSIIVNHRLLIIFVKFLSI